MKLPSLVPISTFMYLWEIYIFPRSVLSRLTVGIYKSLTDTQILKLGDRALSFYFGNNEAAQLHFWEYLNRTVILDFQRPFICSAVSWSLKLRNFFTYCTYGQRRLKGQCHELFDLQFSWTLNNLRRVPWWLPNLHFSFFSLENSRRYSQLKVHDWCQRHCNSAKYFWNYSIFYESL